MRRNPGYTALVVCTLGLGIGAATAVFSAVDGVLLKPLPFRDPDALITLWHTRPDEGSQRDDFAPATFLDLRDRASNVVELAAANPYGLNLRSATTTEHVEAWQLSDGFLEMMGVTPLLGRGFVPEDHRTGAAPVLLLAHGYWQRRFGGDPSVIGATLTVDEQSATIIGVMPPGFALPEATDMWTPWSYTDDQRNDRFSAYIRVFGRLRPGVTFAQAQSTFDALAAQLGREFPRSDSGARYETLTLEDFLVGAHRPLLWTLLAAAGVLLIVALANVATLHLTRLGRQRRETLVRSALGASWAQRARHLLAETLVLASLGTALGIGLSWAGVKVLHRLGPADLARLNEIRVDWRAAGAAAVLALLAAAVLALPPLLRLSRERLATARTVVGHRWASTPRRLVVGGQLALGLLLLIGTTLLVRSFMLALNSDWGYETDRRLSFTTWVYDEYPDGAKRLAFVQDVIARLGALPGVRSMSTGSALPLAAEITGEETDIIPEGMAVTQGQEPTARGTIVWPTYFETLGMRLVQGRGIVLTGDGRAPRVVVVNEAFVRRFFPGQDPIGRTVAVGLMGRAQPRQIVGVVRDTRHARLDAPPEPAVFIPWTQQPMASLTFILRTDVDPGTLIPAVNRTMFEIDPRVGVARMTTLDALVSLRLRERRFMLTLLGAFAVTAVVIAMVGVFGAMSQAVAERTREIGVRMALGASPSTVLGEFLAEAGRTAAIGVGAGLVIALFATTALTRFLYGIARLDALSVGVAVGIVCVLAVVAAALPSRRAARINPATVLGAE